MKFLRRFFIRLSNLATGQSADQRLQDEIAEHLADRYRDRGDYLVEVVHRDVTRPN